MSPHHFVRDSYHRHSTIIAEGVTAGFKLLPEDHERRIGNGVHAYVVLDLMTPFGSLRARDIRVQWSRQNERFFIRWKAWNTGRERDGKPEWLDVLGPVDPETRAKFESVLVECFEEILEQSRAGTLGKPPVPEGVQAPTLGDQPELAGKLETAREEAQERETQA